MACNATDKLEQHGLLAGAACNSVHVLNVHTHKPVAVLTGHHGWWVMCYAVCCAGDMCCCMVATHGASMPCKCHALATYLHMLNNPQHACTTTTCHETTTHRVHAVAFCPFMIPAPVNSDTSPPNHTTAVNTPAVNTTTAVNVDQCTPPDRIMLVSAAADRCLGLWRVSPNPSRVRNVRLKGTRTPLSLAHARYVIGRCLGDW